MRLCTTFSGELALIIRCAITGLDVFLRAAGEEGGEYGDQGEDADYFFHVFFVFLVFGSFENDAVADDSTNV